jgi:predicted  nucleic acid-binding Zn-ribbon protein
MAKINMQAFSEVEQLVNSAEHAVRVLLQLKPALVEIKEIAAGLSRAAQQVEAANKEVSEAKKALGGILQQQTDAQARVTELMAQVSKYQAVLDALRA